MKTKENFIILFLNISKIYSVGYFPFGNFTDSSRSIKKAWKLSKMLMFDHDNEEARNLMPISHSKPTIT
jgi:hypothetical protein